MTQEHVHIAINHLPFLGSGIAIIPIIVGILLRNKTTLITGLAIAVLSGWTTPMVMSTGESAYERYDEGAVRPFLDSNVEQALESHEERAETWSKVMYLSAITSTLALGISIWRFVIGRYLAMGAAIVCLAALGSGMWIAESGGKIRRPDFRLPASDGSSANNKVKRD
jgi:hypothetical protein